jgi:hypothetical protein
MRTLQSYAFAASMFAVFLHTGTLEAAETVYCGWHVHRSCLNQCSGKPTDAAKNACVKNCLKKSCKQ